MGLIACVIVPGEVGPAGPSSGNVVTGVVVTILILLAVLVVGGVAGFIIWRKVRCSQYTYTVCVIYV